MTIRVLGTVLLLSLVAASPASNTSTPAYNASQLPDSQILTNPYPIYFPVLPKDNGVSGAFPMDRCGKFVLEEATIDQMQTAMKAKKLTSVQLTTCYLKRIEQTNQYINSVLEINPDVLAIAAALDSERASGHVRGPLHGIPFLIKDNIASKDKLETTSGSWALLGSVVPRDAHVVYKLREAGAVLLGHATLSEWADMRSNIYSEGYSGRGGQARSPYNLTVNPGGSSSGSGAAIAANVAAFALGTETDGSVINPAERNALVGIKPTVGLTSRAGVIPESSHQDTVGCLARTLLDATYCLDAIYGADQRDNYTLAQINNKDVPAKGYAQFVAKKSALKGVRFGIPWDSFWKYADADQQAQLLVLVNLIKDAGAVIVNGTELPNRDLIVSPNGWNWDLGTSRGFANESEFTVVKVDFYNDIAAYLSELENTNIRSLEDIVQYNIDNVGTEGGLPNIHPAFSSGQDAFLASLETKGIRDATYWQALGFCQTQTRELGIDAALKNGGDGKGPVVALLVPPDVGQTYQIAAQAGYPVITLPAGVHPDTGMPFGLALMGTAWSEGTLVKYASAIEDVQRSTGTKQTRTSPKWLNYLTKNIPVNNL